MSVDPRHDRFAAWFAGIAKRRLHRTFGAPQWLGIDEARGALAGKSAVIVANHTSYWDGLVAMVVSERLGGRGYALMDAVNLKKRPFFALCGGIGIDRSSLGAAARGLRTATQLVKRPGALLWVFPQGSERPPNEPLAFAGGAAAIAKHAEVPVLPIGLMYQFGDREQPYLWVACGELLPPTATAAEQESAVAVQLRRIEQAIVANNESVIRRSAPISLAERWLAWLVKPWTKAG